MWCLGLSVLSAGLLAVCLMLGIFILVALRSLLHEMAKGKMERETR